MCNNDLERGQCKGLGSNNTYLIRATWRTSYIYSLWLCFIYVTQDQTDRLGRSRGLKDVDDSL